MGDLVPSIIESISGVANNLIDKMAAGVGWIFTHDTNMKRAEERYIEEIKKRNYDPLYEAALISRAKKDIKEYSNQCKIVNGSIEYIHKNAKPEDLENDWISQFLDKARLVSDEECQQIWSRLLAEECNKPGSIPKSLLFTLEKMGREDAEDFQSLCSATVHAFNEFAPLVCDYEDKTLNKLGLNYDSLVQLESIGLIKLDNGIWGPSFALTKDKIHRENQVVSYYNNMIELPDTMDSFPVGNVLFTKDGGALCKIIAPSEIDDFWKNTVSPWIERSIKEHNLAWNPIRH